MSDTIAIEIDFHVHKAIEAERRSFNETQNDVLRRLLGITATPERRTEAIKKSWTGYGVTLPHGTELKMSYNNVSHTGRIDDGRWMIGGDAFSSPSGAASGVARTKSGGKTKLDGWNYWHVKLPGSAGWVPLYALWESAKASQKG